MLLELADDLLDGVSEEDARALEVLLYARRLGYHLLTGSTEVFSRLPHVVDLSDGAAKTLRVAKQKQYEKAKLIQAVSHRIKVSQAHGPAVANIDGVSVVTLRL